MSEPPQHRSKDVVLDPIDLKLLDLERAEAQAWMQRFGGIWFTVKRALGPPLLLSRAAKESRLIIDQYDGGRDVQYFFISRQDQKTPFDLPPLKLLPPRETIGYLPQVAGTDILYDLTDETMQGKCRPFVCDLTTTRCRVYALLPTQVEATELVVAGQGKDRKATVEFHDARGERLQGMFPFQFRIEVGGKEIKDKSGYYCTEADGRFNFPAKLLSDLPINCQLTVRSQLTGWGATAKLGP
jgi:hypothetical protein